MTAEYDYTRIPDLPASVCIAPLKKPERLRADWLEPAQRQYSTADHRIWDELYARQIQLMPGHACKEFMLGLEKLDLGRGGVPDFNAMSEELKALTGWSRRAGANADSGPRFLLSPRKQAFSRPATSSVHASSSTTSRSRTFSTTCSGTCRC